MSGILVVQEAGHSRISQQALSAGRSLAGLTGLALATATVGDSNSTVSSGPPLETTYAVQHPLLAHYTADGYVLALEQLIRKIEPAYIVFPHTYQVRDYVPRLATRFKKVLIGDVTAIAPGPLFVRQLFQGKMNATYCHQGGGLCFLSIQSGAFREYPETAPTSEVHPFVPEISAGDIRTKPGEPSRGSTQSVDLTSAQRIVSVGRGIQHAANIAIAQELATTLGAELAASRPICDSGWLPMDRQVGSSGQTVSPKLYLAIGISGAIQHLVGIKGSQCIVAINKDADAPIFEVADYGIVGDLFEVVPALLAALKAASAI
jgi:electron transfer flavoprotein alpha subunit